MTRNFKEKDVVSPDPVPLVEPVDLMNLTDFLSLPVKELVRLARIGYAAECGFDPFYADVV